MKLIFAILALTTTESNTVTEDASEDPHLAHWAAIFASPKHTWRADLGYMAYHWDEVTDYSANPAYRLRLGYRINDWIGTEVSAEYTGQSTSSGALNVSNGMWSLGGFGGFERWFSGFRIAGFGGAGVVLRTSEISDLSGQSYSATDVDPWTGGRFGMGVSILKHGYVGVDADVRIRPQAVDWSIGIAVGWLWSFD